MARVAHREQLEITMDYANLPDVSARSRSNKHSQGAAAAAPGRKLARLVAVSFGLLCILQAAINISLRFAFYSKTSCIKTVETEELKNLTDQYFQQGWVYFRPSFYYISSIAKSWKDSRDDCLQRGADLAIINTKEEQDFTRNFKKVMWIGLTETAIKGTWKWVDGTPLSKSYWGPDEPNGFEGKNEDCVEINFFDFENSWNDIPCENQNFWICEKKLVS
ncbi:CD209 antigen-like protein E [Haplochromis burtoni]|uniref:CD209 antigen-like protein E n=1 Tax=Haplochromis burtoni TaxID=8153 RepID=A0A3Q3CAE5_HAPBU|nr:CD209 antigen-like protein E [Haplochromis burtoni]